MAGEPIVGAGIDTGQPGSRLPKRSTAKSAWPLPPQFSPVPTTMSRCPSPFRSTTDGLDQITCEER